MLASAAGPTGAADAVAFDGRSDRIYVAPSPTLTAPGGVRAHVVVAVEELGHRRTLVEGYLSFAVFAEADGSIGGSVYRYGEWNGIHTRPALVTLGSWMEVSFTAAYGLLLLTVDGQLEAEGYRWLGEGDGISWPFGLSIGAWPDAAQRVLKGRMAELRLWRSSVTAEHEVRAARCSNR